MTAFDRAACDRLVAGEPAEMEWDADAYDAGSAAPSSDYVDGWNDAVGANAIPLREALRSALTEVDRLRAAQTASAERVWQVVAQAVADVLALNCAATATVMEIHIAGVVLGKAVADHVAAQLAGPSQEGA